MGQNQPNTVLLSPDETKISTETWFENRTRVRNVTVATLTSFVPEKPNGKAVLIIPGGGFLMLSIQEEGTAVAEKLASTGITAFLLKYRLRPTSRSEAAFKREIGQMFVQGMNGTIEPFAPATEDAITAMRWIDDHADKFGITSDSVGLVGFSAGAITLLDTIENDELPWLPGFIAPIYGPVTERTKAIDVPLFVALASDDPLFGKRGFGLIEQWRAAGYPLEFHLYQNGGHGFGLGKNGTSSEAWFSQFQQWLYLLGWIDESE